MSQFFLVLVLLMKVSPRMFMGIEQRSEYLEFSGCCYVIPYVLLQILTVLP